jgi:hypothetical protein
VFVRAPANHPAGEPLDRIFRTQSSTPIFRGNEIPIIARGGWCYASSSTHEVLSRPMRDRRAVPRYAGLRPPSRSELAHHKDNSGPRPQA